MTTGRGVWHARLMAQAPPIRIPAKVDHSEDDAPASKSTAGGSVGQLVAETGAATLRDLGLADLSPRAISQLAGLVDQLGVVRRTDGHAPSAGTASAPAPAPSQDPASATRTILLALAAVFGVVLIVGALRIVDRLQLADQAMVERLAALEARIAEAEGKRLERQAVLDQAEATAKLEAEALAADVELLKARQSALVLHLLEGQVRLAKAQGVELPEPGPVLKIAQAEASLGK
ncbi:MAG: hypothetical protein KC457_00945 [Myxococcales bacterium]|nr:hypothetical protein [Myxococcales bacterium]